MTPGGFQKSGGAVFFLTSASPWPKRCGSDGRRRHGRTPDPHLGCRFVLCHQRSFDDGSRRLASFWMSMRTAPAVRPHPSPQTGAAGPGEEILLIPNRLRTRLSVAGGAAEVGSELRTDAPLPAQSLGSCAGEQGHRRVHHLRSTLGRQAGILARVRPVRRELPLSGEISVPGQVGMDNLLKHRR